jgi:CMP-N,N'-diacetyllegionaminic acid synthase
MKILGVTLARGGSKSVPKKNIKLLAGIPLIAHTIREALLSSYISRYVVSTDDIDIQKIALTYGAESPFLRPAELATDTASSVAALQNAVAWVEREEGVKYDCVIELMATNPLKTVNDIDACISKLIDTGADSVIAVHRLDDHHPARIKKILNDRIVDFCVPEKLESRRQDLTPQAYIRSGSIYALQRNHLMVQGQRYGSIESRPYILPPERAINIDSEIDFMIAEQLLKKIADSTLKRDK